MPQTYRCIAQIVPSASTSTDLYTVPASTSVIVSTLVVCNQTTSNTTFRVSLRSGTAAAGAGTSNVGSTGTPSTSAYIFYDTTVYANSTVAVTLGITATDAEVFTVYTPGNPVSFQLYGSVIT